MIKFFISIGKIHFWAWDFHLKYRFVLLAQNFWNRTFVNLKIIVLSKKASFLELVFVPDIHVKNT